MNLARVSWIGTAVFAASAAVAVASDATAARGAAVAVALVLFVAGTVAMLAAVVVAAGRSRTEEIAVGSLFLFQGPAARAGRPLHLATAVQTVVALVSASLRPYTSLAFGILVPIFGLGLTGLWGARHSAFPPRVPGGRGAAGR